MNLYQYLQIQINLHELDDGFTFHCPFPSQWNFRAKELCHLSDGYHCLYDTNKVQNIEACRDEPQFEAPGNLCISTLNSFRNIIFLKRWTGIFFTSLMQNLGCMLMNISLIHVERIKDAICLTLC